MNEVDRRFALTLGAAAAASGLLAPSSSSAQTSGSAEGKEIAPGVRQIDHGKRESMLPGYKTVSMRDWVYQPGSSTTFPTMPHDMVCHLTEGELMVNHGPGKDFVVKKGDVWSCIKGQPENGKNNGSTVAVMRVIDLLPT